MHSRVQGGSTWCAVWVACRWRMASCSAAAAWGVSRGAAAAKVAALPRCVTNMSPAEGGAAGADVAGILGSCQHERGCGGAAAL